MKKILLLVLCLLFSSQMTAYAAQSKPCDPSSNPLSSTSLQLITDVRKIPDWIEDDQEAFVCDEEKIKSLYDNSGQNWRDSKWREYVINTLNSEPRPNLVRALELIKEQKLLQRERSEALDLGAGAGNEALHLMQNGWKTWALDSDRFAINTIAECSRQAKLEHRLGVILEKMEDMKLGVEKYDLVNASYPLPFVAKKDFAQVWGKVVKTLRKGGVFTGTFFGEKHDWRDKKDMTFQTEKEVRTLFEKNGFRILEFRPSFESTRLASGKKAVFHEFTVIAVKE